MKDLGQKKYLALNLVGITVLFFLATCFSELPVIKGKELMDIMTKRNQSICESSLGAKGWHEKAPKNLRSQIQSYLNTPQLNPAPQIRAMIVPHAGYTYSGEVAGKAYKQVQNQKYDNIIILAPSHYYSLKNLASLPHFESFKTPLGTINLDLPIIKSLSQSPFVSLGNAPHIEEHSIQIQLPFIQTLFPNTPIVPILLGQFELSKLKDFSEWLKKHLKPTTLVIISSDFLHYGPRFNYTPFPPDQVKEKDFEAIKLIQSGQGESFYEWCNTNKATICGRHPITSLLLLEKNLKPQLLNYATSEKVSGNSQNTVSYASLYLDGTWEQGSHDPDLEENQNKQLIQLARESIETKLFHRTAPQRNQYSHTLLDKERACFVTIKLKDRLRGCIGEIYPSRSLFEAIVDQAQNAAFRDSRFSPISKEEFPQISIEISILTQPHKSDAIKNIQIGKHGIILKKGFKKAVFLPHVATEQGWTLEETLTHLSIKAGLNQNAWKEGCEFEVFESILITE